MLLYTSICFAIIHIVLSFDLTPPGQTNSSITKCITAASRVCVVYGKTTLVHYNDEITKPPNNLLSKIITELTENKIPIIITNEINNINETKGIDDNIVIITAFENYRSLVQYNLHYDIKFDYLIIIESYVNTRFIFEEFASLETFDVTFVVFDQIKQDYVFLTFIPEIDGETCGFSNEVELVEINKCVNEELQLNEYENVFPSKHPRNLNRCPFKVGMASLYPYSVIENKESLRNLDPIENIHGADLEIMKIITKEINASLELYYIFREEENPYLHLEYVEYIFNGTLDACAGGLYRIYGNVVEYSGIYSSQSVLWVYYTERDIRSWQSLIMKINGLYYFLIFYLCYVFVWNLVSRFDTKVFSITKTLVYSWGALLGTTSLEDARTIKQKILNIGYLIMSLHLSAYISAQIYSYLTIQGPPPVYKTADELRDSIRKPYLRFSTKYFIRDYKYETFANTSGECADFLDCLNTLLKLKGSTILLDSYLPPFQSVTAVDDEARVYSVSESILTVYHEMIIKKDSPLVFKYQNVIKHLFEAGICQKLYNEAIGITVVDRAEIAVKNIMSNSYSCTVGCEITMEQSAGAFYIWILGCALSSFVFVLEVLWDRRLN